MKKLLLICMCSFMFITSRAQTGNGGTPIDFSTELTHVHNGNVNIPRGPVCPPEAMLSGHTLYILTSHGDYDLQLLSSDGSVVYETFVSSTVNEVVLPSSLTGCFKLQLWAEPYVFIGEIEL